MVVFIERRQWQEFEEMKGIGGVCNK